MKKLSSLGKALSKMEQQQIAGGFEPTCKSSFRNCGNALQCPRNQVCHLGVCMCPDDI